MRMKKNFFLLTLVILMLVLTSSTTIVSGASINATTTDLYFSQVDFRFKKLTVLNSNWGRLRINTSAFLDHYGMDEGFLNIRTDKGWVLQNQFINRVTGHTAISIDFNLGNEIGNDVRSLSVYIQFINKPVTSFEDGPREEFPVDNVTYDAEGNGHDWTTQIGDPMPFLDFDINMPTFNFTKPLREGENVQCASNQCYPMAVANSLQYLENQYLNIIIPHNHTIGLKGDDSLVGQLDTYSGRSVVNRTEGGGVNNIEMLKGKFEYLAAIGMDDDIIHRHQGYHGGITPGNITHAGITSIDDTINGNVTFLWLYDRLKECADVEIGYFRDGGGGHAIRVIGCGKTLGQPWIRYIHDGMQTGNDPTDTQGLAECQAFVSDLDGDGIMNLNCASAEIGFALAETPKAIQVTELTSGFGLTVQITNFGPMQNPNLPWSIEIRAPFMFLGKLSIGTINLPAYDSVKIRSKLPFGLGLAQITITLDEIQEIHRGLVLGPIIVPLKETTVT